MSSRSQNAHTERFATCSCAVVQHLLAGLGLHQLSQQLTPWSERQKVFGAPSRDKKRQKRRKNAPSSWTSNSPCWYSGNEPKFSLFCSTMPALLRLQGAAAIPLRSLRQE